MSTCTTQTLKNIVSAWREQEQFEFKITDPREAKEYFFRCNRRVDKLMTLTCIPCFSGEKIPFPPGFFVCTYYGRMPAEVSTDFCLIFDNTIIMNMNHRHILMRYDHKVVCFEPMTLTYIHTTSEDGDTSAAQMQLEFKYDKN